MMQAPVTQPRYEAPSVDESGQTYRLLDTLADSVLGAAEPEDQNKVPEGEQGVRRFTSQAKQAPAASAPRLLRDVERVSEADGEALGNSVRPADSAGRARLMQGFVPTRPSNPAAFGEGLEGNAIELMNAMTERLLAPGQPAERALPMPMSDGEMASAGVRPVGGTDGFAERVAADLPAGETPYEAYKGMAAQALPGMNGHQRPLEATDATANAMGQQIDVDALAERLNELLVEQARRHGVSLL
jgi:hypothetical protein